MEKLNKPLSEINPWRITKIGEDPQAAIWLYTRKNPPSKELPLHRPDSISEVPGYIIEELFRGCETFATLQFLKCLSVENTWKALDKVLQGPEKRTTDIVSRPPRR